MDLYLVRVAGSGQLVALVSSRAYAERICSAQNETTRDSRKRWVWDVVPNPPVVGDPDA